MSPQVTESRHRLPLSSSWRGVEPSESDEQAAVRKTAEEVGITVTPVKRLGERIHPATGRTMLHVACSVLDGTAYVADKEEVVGLEWCDRAKLTANMPYPFYALVQEYFDAILED